jgi:hypothetical protein
VPSQNFVDEGLVPYATPACFLAELIEHPWIDSNCDQLARLVAQRRPADPPHGLQLLQARWRARMSPKRSRSDRLPAFGSETVAVMGVLQKLNPA